MRAFKLVALMVLVAMVLTACAQPAAAPAPGAKAPAAGGEMKVAILAPLSGAVPTFGVMTRDGALLAIEEWNAKGGVNGKKIVPVVEDSQCTPDPAVNAANKVIDQDKVKFIIGEVCSKASIPVSEIANAKKVIQISPTSTNPDVTVAKDGKTKDYIFRACFIDPFQGKVGAKFAMDNLKAKTAFIMLDQANDYVKGLAEEFEKAFVGGRRQDRRQGNLHGQGHRLLGHPVQGRRGQAGRDLPARLLQHRQPGHQAGQGKGHHRPVPRRRWLGLLGPGQEGRGGWLLHQPLRPGLDGAEAVDLPEGVRRRSTRARCPDALAALAYDATNLLLTSIKNAGAEDTDKVKAAMEGITLQGVSGKITFDKQHNPVKSATILQGHG